jgi:AraC-like DNA-binding protein
VRAAASPERRAPRRPPPERPPLERSHGPLRASPAGVILDAMRPLSPGVARLVQDLEILRGRPSQPPWHLAKLPDGTATLLLRVLDPAAGHGDLSVSGPRTRALFKRVDPAPLALCVRFRPGGLAPFLGVPLDELTDRIVPLDALWGARGSALRDALLEARSDEQRLALVESALLERAARAPEPARARLVRRAMAVLGDPARPTRVDALASALHVSDRHLRRAFSEVVGIGPRAFARQARLHRAIRRMHGRTTWTALAADAGYYDQAHMIAEFRDLVGTTPAAFARMLPTLQRW